jgi:hypothetical protein
MFGIYREVGAMTADERRDAIRRFFAGLTEYTFHSHLGVADPPLVDYVSDLLVRFVRTDRIYAMRRPTGRRLSGVADMMREADARIGEARREAHRHIGDFTLFWAGVYPEALQALQAEGRKDRLLSYYEQGRRAYLVASTIPSGDEHVRPEVLQRLSDEFDLCAYGLGEVRREWERQDDDTAGILWVN